jgi:hypothetical protein
MNIVEFIIVLVMVGMMGMSEPYDPIIYDIENTVFDPIPDNDWEAHSDLSGIDWDNRTSWPCEDIKVGVSYE